MPALIHPTALQAQTLCDEMTTLAYEFCNTQEYIEKGEAFKEKLFDLARLGEFGALSELTSQITYMLEESAYEKIAGKKPYAFQMKYETLEYHLKNFGAYPGKTVSYVWGDPVLDNLIVTSALKSQLPSFSNTLSGWMTLGMELAKTGSVAAWDLLFSSLGRIPEIQASAQGSAVLTIALFPEQVRMEHAELFQAHVDRYEEIAEGNGRYFQNHAERGSLFVQPRALYDALTSLDRVKTAYRYMSNDSSNGPDDYNIQRLIKDYGWLPDRSWQGFSQRSRSWGQSRFINSMILHLLTLELDGHEVSLRFGSPAEVLKVLGEHDTEHEFGVIRFQENRIDHLVDAAVGMVSGNDRYRKLREIGFSDELLVRCERLSEERLGADLGL
jgi:hypothetical protein